MREPTGSGGTKVAADSRNKGTWSFSCAWFWSTLKATSSLRETLVSQGGAIPDASRCAGIRPRVFPNPVWQTGAGVPKDGARDIPDVAMGASSDKPGYFTATT